MFRSSSFGVAKRATWPQTITYPRVPIVVTVRERGKTSRHIWKKGGLRGGQPIRPLGTREVMAWLEGP